MSYHIQNSMNRLKRFAYKMGWGGSLYGDLPHLEKLDVNSSTSALSSLDDNDNNNNNVIDINYMDSIVESYYEKLKKYCDENVVEYELLDYIYKLGFTKFERVGQYQTHLEKIKRYLNYKDILEKFKGLENYMILNSDIIDELIEKHDFSLNPNSEYTCDISNDNILSIKNSFDDISNILDFTNMYNFSYIYSAYNTEEIYEDDNPHIDTFIRLEKEFKDKLKEDNTKASIRESSFTWIVRSKPIHILESNSYTCVLFQLNDSYVVLTSWGVLEADGMSFQDFVMKNSIKNNKNNNEESV